MQKDKNFVAEVENDGYILDFPTAIWVSVWKSWTKRNWAITLGAGLTVLKVLLWAPNFWVAGKEYLKTEKISPWKNARSGQWGNTTSPWHDRLNLEVLTNSNTELIWDRSDIKARCVFFRNSCHAEAFYSLVLRRRAESRSCYVWFINLLCSTSYVRNFRASPEAQMSAVGSQWFLAAQRSFFTWIPPCERFEIHHWTISYFIPACYFRSRN